MVSSLARYVARYVSRVHSQLLSIFIFLLCIINLVKFRNAFRYVCYCILKMYKYDLLLYGELNSFYPLYKNVFLAITGFYFVPHKNFVTNLRKVVLLMKLCL